MSGPGRHTRCRRRPDLTVPTPLACLACAWLVATLSLGCGEKEPGATGTTNASSSNGSSATSGGPEDAGAKPTILSSVGTSIQPTHETTDAGDRTANTARVESMTLLEEMQALDTQRGRRGRAERVHSRALNAHKKGKYKNAETLWAEAARRDPAWERPFYNLACATAMQGRYGDALAYLRMVARRQIDYRRLRKVETDPDLAELRKRPELREVVELLSEQLLVGSHRPKKKQLFSGSSRKSPCQTFTLDPHGQYSHGCKAKYATKGEWAYSRGVLYFRVTSFQKDCDARSCPSIEVNDYDALAITRLDDKSLCLERVAPERKWPVARELGATVSAPKGTITEGCYE